VSEQDLRPPVWVGHVILETDRLEETAQFMRKIGLRPIVQRPDVAVLELRGGTHLVLTARRRDRLDELAAELSAKHQIRTEVIAVDLSQPEAPEKIYSGTRQMGIEIELLINNAGFGQYGELPTVETQRLLDMVQVNCSAVVHLTRLYLPYMLKQRRGDVLIVASTASFQAVPFISTYAASKAFDLFFAEGLAEEVKPA